MVTAVEVVAAVVVVEAVVVEESLKIGPMVFVLDLSWHLKFHSCARITVEGFVSGDNVAGSGTPAIPSSIVFRVTGDGLHL